MTQAQNNYQGADFYRTQNQEQGQQEIDSAALMAELLERPLYQQKTSYTPFMGTPDNQVTLSPGMVLQFFAKPTKTGQLCTYEQAVRFIMLCKARGLDPREGDAFLVGYDTKNGPEFNLITAHQAFLKRAEASKEFDGMESGVIVQHTETDEVKDIEGDLVPEDCRLIGGWARVYRKDRGHPTLRRLDVAAFNKGVSLWGSNPAGMICKCAEADALRSTFPNSLAGMYTQGEFQPESTRVEDPRTSPGPSKGVKEAIKASKNTGAVSPTAKPGNVPVLNNAGGTPTTDPSTSGRPKAKATVVKCPECGYPMAGGQCPNGCAVQAGEDVQVVTQTGGTGPAKESQDSAGVPTPSSPTPPAAEDFPDEDPEQQQPPEDPKARHAALVEETKAKLKVAKPEEIDAIIGMSFEDKSPRGTAIWEAMCKAVKGLKTGATPADLLGPMKKQAAFCLLMMDAETPKK